MSQEENKDAVRQVIEEAFNKGNVDALDKLYAPGYREYQFGMPATMEGFKESVLSLRAAFPDLELTIEEMCAEGDSVWVRMTARGTHGGPFMGAAPTGRTIEISVFDLVRFREGKITEHWGVPDRFAVMHQIGALKRPSQAA